MRRALCFDPHDLGTQPQRLIQALALLTLHDLGWTTSLVGKDGWINQQNQSKWVVKANADKIVLN